ncbi:MAG: transporter [Bacteroidia bacterium]|nr:transporter [Bacteroidia bacterium]
MKNLIILSFILPGLLLVMNTLNARSPDYPLEPGWEPLAKDSNQVVSSPRLARSPVLSPLRKTSGWVPGKGNGFFKLGQNAIRADRFFSPLGNVTDITTTSLYISSFYGEYGLSKRLTAIAYVPFFVRVTLNEVRFEPSQEVIPGDELNAVGDIDLSLKYGLIQNKPFVLSVSLTLGIPSGEPGGGTTRLLQSGDGEFNQMLLLHAGYAVPSTRLYLAALVGVNNRSEDFSEEFRYGLEAGYSFSDRFLAAIKILGVQSFENGEALGSTNGIFSNNTEYLAITPEVNYFFNDHWGISANVGFAASGQNILASPNFSFGVFYKLIAN